MGHLDAVHAYWCDQLRVEPERYSRQGNLVVPGDELSDPFHGLPLVNARKLVVYRRPDTSVVVAPETLRPRLEKALSPLEAPVSAEEACRLAGLTPSLLPAPEFIHYLDPAALPELSADGIRTLTEADRGAVERLKAACSRREAETANVHVEHSLVAGAFHGPSLLAAASLIELGGAVMDVGVLTHPDHRKKGLARRVAGLLSRLAVDRGHVVQYWAANPASRAVAQSLGFAEYGTEEVAIGDPTPPG